MKSGYCSAKLVALVSSKRKVKAQRHVAFLLQVMYMYNVRKYMYISDDEDNDDEISYYVVGDDDYDKEQ